MNRAAPIALTALLSLSPGCANRYIVRLDEANAVRYFDRTGHQPEPTFSRVEYRDYGDDGLLDSKVMRDAQGVIVQADSLVEGFPRKAGAEVSQLVMQCAAEKNPHLVYISRRTSPEGVRLQREFEAFRYRYSRQK